MAQTRPRPNRLKRPWRLRTRLSLALVALFVAIAVLVVVSHYERLSDIRESRVENLETVNETLAEVVDGFARDPESVALARGHDERLPGHHVLAWGALDALAGLPADRRPRHPHRPGRHGALQLSRRRRRSPACQHLVRAGLRRGQPRPARPHPP